MWLLKWWGLWHGLGCGSRAGAASTAVRAATVRELPNQPLRASFLNKILLFKPAAPNKLPASCTAQLSNQTEDSLGQGPLEPNFSPFSRRHLAAQYLW